MAHLADDRLPTDFDVIVQGTGLIESILAGALARCGKSVLHIDRNGFYGGLWASLMHREMQEWLLQGDQHDEQRTTACEDQILPLKCPFDQISNLTQNVYHHGHETASNKASESDEELPSTRTSLDWETLDPLKRRLVYDISPKVLACRGRMVDTLTKSGCHRYVEFKAVNRVCVYQSGTVEQVPCSRADVFESKLVSMLEKRKMMKFLAFCSHFEQEVDVEDLRKLTFKEYLKTTDLTESLIGYVSMCIAMTEENASALEVRSFVDCLVNLDILQGLQAAKLFLDSLGRFDNAPFLYPIFGGGELPQAFCRYCAVFGGVYCLKRSINAFILSKPNQCMLSGITCSNGQKISCRDIVCNASTVATTFGIKPNVKVSRAILLTSGPIKNTKGKLTLLNIPPFSAGETQGYVVRVLQLDSSTNTSVDGTYMVHFMCSSIASNAKQDLEAVVQLLYNSQECGPHILWSLFFNLDMYNVESGSLDSANEFSNLYLTSDPDSTMTFEAAVQEAEKIFQRLCPEKEFF